MAASPPPPSPSSAPSTTHPGALLPLLFFVSGAVALVYEVVWQRQFALLFGSAAPATAAVLAAYFAGLGAGAWLFGKLAHRRPRPLAAYAALELAVGLGALLVTPVLAACESFYPALFAALSPHPVLFTAARLATAFVALAVPTVCMGGTLPLLGRLVDQDRHRLGQTAGRLYAVNTAGAALGALAVPFLLLPQLGLAGSVRTCAALNGLLAAAAWWLSRRAPASVAPPPAAETPRRRAEPAPTSAPTAGLLPALISGVATFALQVLWNRAFAQVHENSMYSFAVLVAVVILALALGAQLARVGLRRGIAPQRLLGGAWILAGLASLAGPWLFVRWTGGLGYLATGAGWGAHAGPLAALAVAVVFVPMTLLGVGLPAVMEHAGRASGRDAGQVLGRLLSVNVAGSVAGALAAGFLLPRWLGLWHALLWIAALVFFAGVGVGLRRAPTAANRRPGAILAAVWLAALWPISAVDLPAVKLAAGRGERLVSLAEGAHGITAVVERDGSRRLKLNNHYALGGTAATGDERMQAHLPLLLHPAPRRVAFLGLGTGISAGGALPHPVENVTVVELVPDVVAAARAHFREANLGVLDDPRTTVVLDDARQYLRGSGARFDVVVGDLVVPWRAGEGALFTREQFAAARAALHPGGLYCQWLPLFQLSETEFRILARTFLAEFPRAWVWRGDFSPTEPALALIGARDDSAPDAATVRRRLGEMRADPANPQLRMPETLWMNFVGVLEAADLPAAETRLNTEDRPWIELLGPLHHGGGRGGDLFTGHALQAWLEQTARASASRWPALPPAEAAAVAAGPALGDMTLALQEQNEPGARAAEAKLRSLLAPETFNRLFGAPR